MIQTKCRHGGYILLLAFSVLGCTHDALAPLDQTSDVIVAYGNVDAHICTDAPAPDHQNLKYLYILDHSASNQPGFPINPGDVSSTDPQGSRRYGPLANFTQNMVPIPDTTTFYGLIDFNDVAAEPGNLQGFDASATDFLNIVNTDWIGGGTAMAPAPDDHGFTNYQAALQLALQMVKADAQLEAASAVNPVVKTAYVIIFVSDGIPTVSTGDSANPLYTQTFVKDIGPVINQIMALKSDPLLGPLIANITLNTAYYDNGTQVVAAEQLLEQMATAGNGQYLQFDSGQNILYQQFAPPSRNLINTLTDVFVQNENAVWWDDGSFLNDSDGDGLPDLIEQQYGSNPYRADSDGNGVSDLVEFRTKGHPCNDAHCAPAGRDLYAICAGFSPVTHPDGSVTFASSSNDGLNDCEKFLLGANRNSFNTNGDMIPDDYAFKSGLPIIPGSSDSAFSDPFIDGIMNYAKVKLGLPVQISRTRLGFFQPRSTVLTQEPSTVLGVSCYHYQVGNIAMSSTNNLLKVMLVQNNSVVQDKPFLKIALGAITDGSPTLTLAPGDFK